MSRFQQSHAPSILGILPELDSDKKPFPDVKCVHCKKYQDAKERKTGFCTKCLKYQNGGKTK
jgi:hypothetical protein